MNLKRGFKERSFVDDRSKMNGKKKYTITAQAKSPLSLFAKSLYVCVCCSFFFFVRSCYAVLGLKDEAFVFNFFFSVALLVYLLTSATKL